jgi:hypothetical protein
MGDHESTLVLYPTVPTFSAVAVGRAPLAAPTGSASGVTQSCPAPVRGARQLFEVAWNVANKRGCAQCAHFGLRLGAYIGRTGSDCRCFLEFPVFAGLGIQFESHLGHA